MGGFLSSFTLGLQYLWLTLEDYLYSYLSQFSYIAPNQTYLVIPGILLIATLSMLIGPKL